jgi:hypothetical protein
VRVRVRQQTLIMRTKFILLMVTTGSFAGWAADSPLSEAPVAIGQPTVFWVNNQWQTWKNDNWVPYGRDVAPREPRSSEADSSQEPLNGSTPAFHRQGRRDKSHDNGVVRKNGLDGALGQPDVQTDQPNIAIGHGNIGIGQPSMAMGPPNVAIGQPHGVGGPDVAIGTPNAGIGQTTIGIGQANPGIGKASGIGQTTIGIGQPNTGLGEPNSVGQPTTGMGKQTEFLKQQHESRR